MKTIKNNIAEKLVSFQVAKLLKEAGFNIQTCLFAFCQSIKLDKPIEPAFERSKQYEPNVAEEWLAPTQQLAIDWIRVNFDIDICINPHYNVSDGVEGYMWDISSHYDKFNSKSGSGKTPEEAKEQALIYCLRNLI